MLYQQIVIRRIQLSCMAAVVVKPVVFVIRTYSYQSVQWFCVKYTMTIGQDLLGMQ